MMANVSFCGGWKWQIIVAVQVILLKIVSGRLKRAVKAARPAAETSKTTLSVPLKQAKKAVKIATAGIAVVSSEGLQGV